MRLIDTHCHLDRYLRAGDLPAVLERAAAEGVEAMIAIGTEPGDWGVYRDLAAQQAGRVYYSVGLHPCSVDENWRGAVEQLAEFRGAAGCVAIGETGLDRFHLPKNDAAKAEALFRWQQDSFRAHLALAAEWRLPVVVHSRGAAAECVELIDASRFDWQQVVFHCFAEGPEMMRELRRRGGRGSFGGVATYRNGENVRQAALAQGLEALMLETDAPYLTPEPHRGKRNEPALVAHVAEALAKLFGVAPEALGEATTRNAREFFRL